MAELLIQKGADVNIVGKYGQTALTIAAGSGKKSALSGNVSDRDETFFNIIANFHSIFSILDVPK